jgi:hypothetical protein
MCLASSPTFWQSKLQATIALSTDKRELIALLEATRFIKAITYLINNLGERKLIATMKLKYSVKFLKIMQLPLKLVERPKYDLVQGILT